MKFKPIYNPHILTCTITIGDWPAAKGIQKLIGFSRGWHHWNSIRLGYNRSEGKDFVRLFMYAYVDGKLIDPKECLICKVNVGETITCILGMTTDYWIIIKGNSYFDLKLEEMPKTCKLGYLLRPYSEIDGTEIQTPLVVDIKDLKINGKIVKIK